MVSGGGYVGRVVFCWWGWVPYLWYVGGEGPVVAICGVSWGSVCVVIDGVVYVCGEAEEPIV